LSLSTVLATSRAAAASCGAGSHVAAALSALLVSVAFAAPARGGLALRFKVNSFADVCEVKAPLGRRRRDCWRRSGLGLFDFQRALGTSCHFVLLA
jgi:hypothetical protein